MSAQHFSPGVRCVWQKCLGARWNTYRVERLQLPEGRVSLQDALTGDTQEVELTVLVRALFDGQLQFVRERKPSKPLPGSAADLSDKFVALDDYPEPLPTIARYRYAVIQPLIDLRPEERTRQMIQARVREVRAKTPATEPLRGLQNSVSVASVYRWMRSYLESGRDERALIPRTHARGGKDRSRIEAMIFVSATWQF